MKKFLVTFLITAFIATISGNTALAQSASAQVELDVKGMTCKGCEYKVKQSLKDIKGVVSTEEVSHETGKVVVTINPEETTKEALAKNLAKATGYTVSFNSSAGESTAAAASAKPGCDPAKCTKTKEECAKAAAEGKPCCSKEQQKECAKTKTSCEKTKE